MHFTPATQPALSNRAAGKARAPDVGFRSRLAQAQPCQPACQPATVSPHQLHSRPPSASRARDLNEYEYLQAAEPSGPVPKPNIKGRPSEADLRQGSLYVNYVQRGVLARLPSTPQADVPPEEEAEYRAAFNALWTHIAEMEPLLPLYACWMAEETIKQLVTANAVVKQQRLCLASESPRFILDLQTVQLFDRQICQLREAIAEKQRAIQCQAADHGRSGPTHAPHHATTTRLRA